MSPNKYRSNPRIKNEYVTNENIFSLQCNGAVTPNISEYYTQSKYYQNILYNNFNNSVQEHINANEAENQINENSDSSSEERLTQIRERNCEYDCPIKVKIGISPTRKKQMNRDKRNKSMEQNDEASKVITDYNKSFKDKVLNYGRIEDSMNVVSFHTPINMNANILEGNETISATEGEVSAPIKNADKIRDKVNTDVIADSSNEFHEYSPNDHIQLLQNTNLKDTSNLDETTCPNIPEINDHVTVFKTNNSKVSGLTEEINTITKTKDNPRLKKQAKRGRKNKIIKEKCATVIKAATDVNKTFKDQDLSCEMIKDIMNASNINLPTNLEENNLNGDNTKAATECVESTLKIRDKVNTDIIARSSNGFEEYSPNNNIQLLQNTNLKSTLDEIASPNIAEMNDHVINFKTNTTKRSRLTKEINTISGIKEFSRLKKQKKMGRKKKKIEGKRNKVIKVVSDVNKRFKDKPLSCGRLKECMNVDNITSSTNVKVNILNADNANAATETVSFTPKAIDKLNSDLIGASSIVLKQYSPNDHIQLQHTNSSDIDLDETTSPNIVEMNDGVKTYKLNSLKRSELPDQINKRNNVNTMDVVNMNNESNSTIQMEDYSNHNVKDENFDGGVPCHFSGESLTEDTAVNESDISTVDSENFKRGARTHTCKSCQVTFEMKKHYVEHRRKHRRILRFC